ncbi:hypothetical protein ACSBR2_001902 [Camellia fascicularis]
MTNHIPAQQIVRKIYPMAQRKRAMRLISSCYSSHAPKPTLLSAFMPFLLCQGKFKASSFPLELPIFMPFLGMLLILATLSIRSPKRMLIPGIQFMPDFYTFPPVLKTCGNLFDGTKIHCWVFKLGFIWDAFVTASLVHMYCRFGNLAVAHKIFSDMPFRDGGSWNAMISGFCQNGNVSEALGVLDEMRFDGMKMDRHCFNYSSWLAQMDDILHGMLIHLYVIKQGLKFDVFVSNALINMFAKFGNIWQAEKVFDQMFIRDLLSWNSIIAAYEQNAHPDTALKFFGEMQSNGIQPDVLTLAKLGIIDSARIVFEEISSKDVVSWNKMITGYGQNGLASEAIEVFCTMEACVDVTPNQGTWVSVFPAYSHIGALKLGMRTHRRILKASLHLDIYVSTCLIDLYGKCGRLDDAVSLFHEVPGETSMQLFQAMQDKEVKLDHVTFVCLLSACSHLGLDDQEYGIQPSLKHYGCMVDLLGRARYLEKAYSFVKNMPLRPDASVWGALLGACRIHGNVELGKFASERLFEVDLENVGYYVLLLNIYANVGKWEGADEVKSLARDRGLKKTPRWGSVELNNWIEVFYTRNQSHPNCEEIYKELEILTVKIKSIGYIPDYSFVLQDVEEDEKEYILMSHSERLAIMYGIISTPPKSPIRIFKNLRVCGDCHNVTKFILNIKEKENIVRD